MQSNFGAGEERPRKFGPEKEKEREKARELGWKEIKEKGAGEAAWAGGAGPNGGCLAAARALGRAAAGRPDPLRVFFSFPFYLFLL